MNTIKASGHEFRMEHDMIDVTSMRRPDVGWKFVDAQGHEHRWYEEDGPNGDRISATFYHPGRSYVLPTLVVVHDGVEAFDDGDDCFDEFHISHYECAQCGEHVNPGTCADDRQQYIPGILRCYVDGRSVAPEEMKRLMREAGLDVPL